MLWIYMYNARDGSVTYVCTCVLAGSLLQRTGGNSG